MKIFVTGSAGFIGYHTVLTLLRQGHQVRSIDNINPFYDPSYKHARLAKLQNYDGFSFRECNLEVGDDWRSWYTEFDPEVVIHLAAQAGARDSLKFPEAYMQSNIVGFQNVVELVRFSKPKNFVFASSSSVYGIGNQIPFQESQPFGIPANLYAATKASNELVASTYSSAFGINATCLRFFTVYGPEGRPDMAPFLFTHKIATNQAIQLANGGAVIRDFTYIDDVVNGIMAAVSSGNGYQTFNIGSGQSHTLSELIKVIEACLGKTAVIETVEMPLADLAETLADISKAKQFLNFCPKVAIEEGMMNFVTWYLAHHGTPLASAG